VLVTKDMRSDERVKGVLQAMIDGMHAIRSDRPFAYLTKGPASGSGSYVPVVASLHPRAPPPST
jgi:hypothetical protein